MDKVHIYHWCLFNHNRILYISSSVHIFGSFFVDFGVWNQGPNVGSSFPVRLWKICVYWCESFCFCFSATSMWSFEQQSSKIDGLLLWMAPETKNLMWEIYAFVCILDLVFPYIFITIFAKANIHNRISLAHSNSINIHIKKSMGMKSTFWFNIMNVSC